jgi:hypothetical protein
MTTALTSAPNGGCVDAAKVVRTYGASGHSRTRPARSLHGLTGIVWLHRKMTVTPSLW